jgi:hypothetical protein
VARLLLRGGGDSERESASKGARKHELLHLCLQSL